MPEKASGVLQRIKQGSGFLRNPEWSFQPERGDVWVSTKLIREYRLVDGAEITGTTRRTEKGVQLDTIESVCGLPPEQFQSRTRFDRLIAIDPNERIRLGDDGNISMRIIEFISPIGKGTRGMIVAPSTRRSPQN